MVPALDIGAYDVDGDLLEATRDDGVPRLRVVRWAADPAVVLGRGGKAEVELNVAACIEDGVRVLRRQGGGCAVVLDRGNLVVSVVLPQRGLGGIKRSFSAISTWLAEAMGRLGIDGVHQRGVSDLVREDRKLGGSCIYRAKDLLYYTTTLLVDPDVGGMERWLAHPPREPDYRVGRRHRDFVGRIVDVDDRWTTTGLAEALRAELRLEDLDGIATRLSG